MSLGQVVALGAHILDVLGRPVESIPPGQGSARLAQIRATAAGTAAGTAVDLAKLGAEVYAVGAVGDDLLADLLESAMRLHGVDTGGLVRVPGTQTSATILPIRSNGERPALHVPGATPLLRLEDIDLARVASARVLMVGAPDALGWLTEHGLADVVAAAKAGGAMVVVDVLRQGSPRDLGRLRGVLAEADWFLPNGEQICAITGRPDPVQAINDVLDLGTAGVAVTLGADGALVATRGGGEPTRVPAIDVAVVDTTGCGDAFNAGMIAGLLLRADDADCAWLGVACGALAATGLGSDAGITDLRQALEFLRDSGPRGSEAAGRLAALAGSETGAGAGRRRAADRALRERALAVIPGGMYGHQAVGGLPADYPQFMRGGQGARVWDVDGNEYVDLMCAYGPVVLGHQHRAVDAAARAQAALGDSQNGPGAVMVELAELLVATVRHADWAMFAKNGTDATTMCCTIARAATARTKILVARGAYHGALPWCTPRLAGVTWADRSNLGHYEYNDLESARAAAVEAGDDLAAVLVSPFRHDAGFDQELVDPAFARGLRELCDRAGAALILDDVRCGFRLHLGGSWEPIGVEPDLSAWSKAIANGHPLAAVLGSDGFRRAAGEVFVTGSFWFSAVPMAAAIATIGALRDEDAIAAMERTGLALRDGIAAQAAAHALEVNYTGPPQMPYLTFAGDRGHELASVFAAEAVRRGAFVHPRHNWFVSAAMTDDDVAAALAATDAAFAAVRRARAEGSAHLAHL